MTTTIKALDISVHAEMSRKGNFEEQYGAFFSFELLKHRLTKRRQIKIGQAADDHKLAYSALVYSRPRSLGGKENSEVLRSFLDSCITPDERGSFIAWVEKFSTWKWVKEEVDPDTNVVKEGRFKHNKSKTEWDFEGAFSHPFMMRDTRKATIQELKDASYVFDKLEDFLSRQRKFLKSDKFEGSTAQSDAIRELLDETMQKVEALKTKTWAPEITSDKQEPVEA